MTITDVTTHTDTATTAPNTFCEKTYCNYAVAVETKLLGLRNRLVPARDMKAFSPFLNLVFSI